MAYVNQWGQNPYGYQSTGMQPYPQQMSNDLIFTVSVNNTQQVENYPVAVGGTVILIDYEHGKLYSKTNPGNGFTPIIKSYSIHADDQQVQNEKKPIDDEISELKKVVYDMKKVLDDLTN